MEDNINNVMLESKKKIIFKVVEGYEIFDIDWACGKLYFL